MRFGTKLWRAGLLLSALCTASPVAFAAEWISSPEKGWPQFRGPQRNGISSEKGLLQSWPEGGPPVVWIATNLGSGYSAPVISGESIYITGDVGDELHIFALDLQGNLRWQATNGAAWRGPYPGARASCTYAGERLYHMNAHGRLACYDARGGKPLWSVDVIKEFDSRIPTWGIAECVLVDGDRVIVTPGGRKASMAALDAKTGKTVWMAEPVSSGEDSSSSKAEGPSYAPPILLQVGGQRHIVGVTARHFIGVEATRGKLQWKSPMPTRYEVIGSSAVLAGDGIFVTGPDAGGGKFLRFKQRDGGVTVEEAWTSTLDTCHGGIIALGKHLYGSWYRGFNGWGCVDADNGNVLYRDRELPMGSVVFADGRLYCLSQSGTMALVRPGPERWDIVSRFEFARERKNDVWAHPVILDGRLYLRHQQGLWCFDIRDPARAGATERTGYSH